jgi:transcriptional regulator with XRE-family HTH domain
MSLIENHKMLVLTSENDESFQKIFSRVFKKFVEEKFNKAKWDEKKNKSAFANKIGVNNTQVSRYISGDQIPNLIVFYKICLELQVEPSKLLGLVWKDNSEILNGSLAEWSVEGDLRGGGLRLYWMCDRCKNKNIEYLDEDGLVTDRLETWMNTKQIYKRALIETARNILMDMTFMCEECGQCYSELKGIKDEVFDRT